MTLGKTKVVATSVKRGGKNNTKPQKGVVKHTPQGAVKSVHHKFIPNVNVSHKTPKSSVTRAHPHAPGLTTGMERLALNRAGSGFPFNDPTQSMSEIAYTITDYFDIVHEGETEPFTGVNQYYFDTSQPLFQPAPELSAPYFTRVTKADFYCLPRFSGGKIDSSETSLLIAYGIPAAGDLGSEENVPLTVGQKTTLLTPTSVYNWVKVGTFKESQFRSTLAAPALSPLPILGMCLGALAILNPDDGKVLKDFTVQCRAVIRVSQSVPLSVLSAQQAVQIPDSALPDFNPWSDVVTGEEGAEVNPNTLPVFVKIRGRSDNV